MRRAALTLLCVVASCTSVWASTAQEYLAARSRVRIAHLSASDTRRSSGNQGRVVEWAGVVGGTANAGEGQMLFFNLPNGDTIALTQSVWLPYGTQAYLLGRVVEKKGFIHHIDPIALAPCADVRKAYAAQEAARRRQAELWRAAGVRTTTAGAVWLNLGALPRTASALTVDGAVRWIHSFNNGIDLAQANDIARTVLSTSRSLRLDERLVLSLLAAESAFHADAVSPAGAQGLGQFMPGTAAAVGLRNPFDARESAGAACRHLSTLMSRWGQSPVGWQLALASYNAGATTVEEYGGVPPYPETINYVRTIHSYYKELSRY